MLFKLKMQFLREKIFLFCYNDRDCGINRIEDYHAQNKERYFNRQTHCLASVYQRDDSKNPRT